MEQDMQDWNKQNTVEQKAQDEPEQIRMGVSSSELGWRDLKWADRSNRLDDVPWRLQIIV
jgi:hypothetical protein